LAPHDPQVLVSLSLSIPQDGQRTVCESFLTVNLVSPHFLHIRSPVSVTAPHLMHSLMRHASEPKE
jgi:hypothetical protein